MGKYLIIIGLLINSSYLIINRFVRKFPNWAAIPVLLLGVVLMITGII